MPGSETPNRSADTSSHSFTPQQLAERMLHRRAVDAAVWGIPAVNYALMLREVEKIGGTYNQIVWWPRLLDWTNQTLTPNPDVIYAMPFFDTKDAGPLVLEVPPADDGVLNGSVMNYWQAAIEDIGPGGVDKGKGGKYLFFPPDFPADQVPDGYIPMSCDTYQGYALIRSVLKTGSDEDVAQAITYTKRLKLYPLSQAANPPETVYVDAAKAIFDSTIKYDLSFYELLDRMVQHEPFLERDRALIDPLKTLGIERGKPFAPDAKTKNVLTSAIAEAHAWIETLYASQAPFYDRKRWFFPATPDFQQIVMSDYKVPDCYPIDIRASLYSLAFFSAKHVGESQFYLMLGFDRDGAPLEGSASYKLTVPAGVPVKQYWSVTVYDRTTHAFLREAPRVGRSSQTPELDWNADGSVDLYYGPAPPEGKEANWVPTKPGEGFELLARFYGPTPALYEKGWQLEDVEKIG
jgi:hypothetical protein